MRLGVTFLPLIVVSLSAQDSQKWLNQGIAAFKNAQYQDAIEAFQKAAELNPNHAATHLYLGTAHMSLYIPGSESAGNLAHARDAEIEFRQTLNLDHDNPVALVSLALLSYHRGMSAKDTAEKSSGLGDALHWNHRILAVDPRNKDAHYSLGVIAWAQFYP